MEFRAHQRRTAQAFSHVCSSLWRNRIVAGAGLARIIAGENASRSRRKTPCPQETSEAEIKTLLSKAKGWSLVNGKLHREFACKDFVTAFGNMTCSR